MNYHPDKNKDVGDVPGLSRAFFVSFGDFNLFGGTSIHEDRARDLIPMFSPLVNSMPSVFGVSIQSGVFEDGIGEGKLASSARETFPLRDSDDREGDDHDDVVGTFISGTHRRFCRCRCEGCASA